MKTVKFKMIPVKERQPDKEGRYFTELDDGTFDFRWFNNYFEIAVWMDANEPRRREVVAWGEMVK